LLYRSNPFVIARLLCFMFSRFLRLLGTLLESEE
jgi:hypothetical protein